MKNGRKAPRFDQRRISFETPLRLLPSEDNRVSGLDRQDSTTNQALFVMAVLRGTVSQKKCFAFVSGKIGSVFRSPVGCLGRPAADTATAQ
jgi:hypothetical protein